MAFSTILYDVSHTIARIVLNRPEVLNAFNDEMIGETASGLQMAARDDKVRCIVITGSGRAFSAGQDLKDVQARQGDFSFGRQLRQGYSKLVRQMMSIEKPVIAAVNGVAAGAGCGVALAADIRIASDEASFIQAFSRVGLVPDCGLTWILPRLIGYARAYEMAIMGDPITADKALDWGMVNEITPPGQFEEIVSAWATRLVNGPTIAFGLTKRAMNRAATIGLTEALEYEAYLQDIASKSHDHKEGIAAFLEKRQPNFRGD
jgi:2-(1,2-epoxy-1,2-dihydrophenyl)acetyl-CoA isomerase